MVGVYGSSYVRQEVVGGVFVRFRAPLQQQRLRYDGAGHLSCEK
jgi:hypothetical protein